MYTRYTRIYTIYTPNTPLNTLHTPVYTPYNNLFLKQVLVQTHGLPRGARAAACERPPPKGRIAAAKADERRAHIQETTHSGKRGRPDDIGCSGEVRKP